MLMLEWYIEDSYSVTRNVDGLDYFLSITDTAGQEEYRGLWAASNLKSDAFLLVYDITNAASLEALDYFLEMIEVETEQRQEDNQRLLRELGPAATGLEVGLPPPVTIVAGNKCDLKDARVLSARHGLDYARQHGCGFMETSAREMVNIEETFACMFCLRAHDHLTDMFPAVIVRRVVDARRHHYHRHEPAQEHPARLMGSSTGRTPALTMNEKAARDDIPKSKQSRHPRFLGLGRSVSKRVSFKKADDAAAHEKTRTGSKRHHSPDEAGPNTKQETWWKRLRCF
jgi:GTPase KRas protein